MKEPEAMEQNKTEIKLDELIMVEPPYNILQDLEMTEYGGLRAKVYSEYLHPDEGGPIGGAECGRHLAILGSIVLAIGFHFKKRHYYLAVHALLNRIGSRVNDSAYFNLYAMPIMAEKSKGKVYAELLDDRNEVLYTAEVEYMIMSPAIFTKFYGNYKVEEVIPTNGNPYRDRRHLSNVVVEGDRIKGDYGTILAHECDGHFRNYPALPVALVGNLFGELGFKLFNATIPGYQKVISPRTSIRAYRLAFSGEFVSFVGRIAKRIAADTILVTAEAKVGDEIVANVEFELKGVNPVSD